MKRKSSLNLPTPKRVRSNEHDQHQQIVRRLKFAITGLRAKHQAIAGRNQRLRDENNRLRQLELSSSESAAQELQQCFEANANTKVNVLDMLAILSRMMEEDSVQLTGRVTKGFNEMVTLLRGG